MPFTRYLSLYRNWTPSDVANWQKCQEQGLLKFLVIEGVVKWGFISVSLFLLFSHNMITMKAPNPVTHILLTISLWSVLGVVYGAGLWYFTHTSFIAHCNRAGIQKVDEIKRTDS